MKESASEPLASSPRGALREGVRSTNQAEVLQTAIQIQVQIDALTTTAQITAKQARLLTQYVGTLGEADQQLLQEHRALKGTNMLLERDLNRAREESEAWRTLAQNVQEMQEMAMAAFERCNALEKENVELRQAMHAFAEGSASATVQQLQKIIAGLTEDVAQYKKREEDLKTKEKTLRNKENNIIIKAMRKQTKELKRRPTLQSKPAEVKELTALATTNVNTMNADTMSTSQPKNVTTSELTSIPTFQEFFFL